MEINAALSFTMSDYIVLGYQVDCRCLALLETTESLLFLIRRTLQARKMVRQEENKGFISLAHFGKNIYCTFSCSLHM